VRKAHSSVWMVVAFAEWNFQMPSGIIWWDLLAQLQQRGVDVRVLFWRVRAATTSTGCLSLPCSRERPTQGPTLLG
jgi:hypothetical protein